jgi:hypothetical protein
MNYKCNNCDYPKGGKAIVWTVNEKIGVSGKQQQQPPDITSTAVNERSDSNTTVNPT